MTIEPVDIEGMPDAPDGWELMENWLVGPSGSGWLGAYHCVCEELLAEVLVYWEGESEQVQIVLAEMLADEYERDTTRRFDFTTPEEEHDELRVNIIVPKERLSEELQDVTSSWVEAIENRT